MLEICSQSKFSLAHHEKVQKGVEQEGEKFSFLKFLLKLPPVWVLQVCLTEEDVINNFISLWLKQFNLIIPAPIIPMLKRRRNS